MKKLLAATLFASFAHSAAANDSMAELKTGGLVFIYSPDVSIEEEHLSISPEMVQVDYRFRNSAERDIQTLVAFPMPDITGGIDMMMAIPDDVSDNFLGFSVSQDGQPIETNLQQRVYVNGVDLTDVVAAEGVPLVPFGEKTDKALEALPKEVLAEWQSLGLIMIDAFDAGNGWEEHPIATWTLKSAYWWKTVYPAGAEVQVHHEYRTSVGGTVSTTYLEDGKAQGERYEDYVDRYCIDNAFVKLAQKNWQSERNGKTLYVENWISYILTTGSNWNGPIGKFTLTLDKGSPKNFISFCGDGVEKIGPTTFRMVKEDFYPERDLEVLLLKSVDW